LVIYHVLQHIVKGGDPNFEVKVATNVTLRNLALNSMPLLS